MSEYELDGHDLDDPAGRWRLTSATSLPTWGALRSTSVEVPGRMGVLETAPVSSGPATVALGFLVEDSGRGSGGLDANLRSLAALLRRHGRLSLLRHSPEQGPVRVAQTRLASSGEPVLYPASAVATLTVMMEVPSGLWRDPAPVTAPASDLSGLDGGSMPVPDALVLVTVTGTPVTVTDRASGSSVSWTGDPQAGRTLLIDPARYRASWTSGVWEGGTDVSAGLSISAGGFHLTPDVDGRHAVTVTGGTAQIRARRAY